MPNDDSGTLTAEDLLKDVIPQKNVPEDEPKEKEKVTVKSDEPKAEEPVNQPKIDEDVPLEERIAEDLKNAYLAKGILEITYNGFGFLRPKFTQSADDIYVSQSQIRKFWLRPGDEIECMVRPPKQN